MELSIVGSTKLVVGQHLDSPTLIVCQYLVAPTLVASMLGLTEIGHVAALSFKNRNGVSVSPTLVVCL